ncbi:MAG TPA: DUF3467 domain-containing protein [Bryobacteraceae bacterium]|jgi:hypothetical protein
MQQSDKLEAKYANYFQIGQNAAEFVIQFGQFYSDEAEPLLHTRIITSPAYAKTLISLLQEAMEKHEAQFGPVREM